MTKKVVISRKDFDALMTRRLDPRSMTAEDVDPMSEVSSDFRAMHARTGASLPKSLRPTADQNAAAQREARPLSDERQAELSAEFDALVADD